MTAKNPASVEEVIWARNGLKTFIKLEKAIRRELGSRGIEKIVLSNGLYRFLLFFSIIINLLGIFFWLSDKKPLYLATTLLPIVSFSFIFHVIKEEKKKNIFRFLGKLEEPEEDLMHIIEDNVFKEKDMLEEIIAWKVQQAPKADNAKYSYMFDIKYWQDLKKAQKQCLVLAILMVSLQKFLHTHRRVYEEHVKMLPLANPGFEKIKPKKYDQNLSPSEIQTFGGGFTSEDLFTGNGQK
jgi:hypothetical protein